MERADGSMAGVTQVIGVDLDTTGWLGVSAERDGAPEARGFPWWMTIPDNRWLSMARAWHFFFAWVLVLNAIVYLGHAIATRHLARDLAPDRADWRALGPSIRDHLRFRHPRGEAARRYNPLQKLAYLAVIFALVPFLVLMGLAMSPWLDTVVPGWVDLVGGRQSARTLHFVAAWLLVAFVAIHVFMVAVSGAWNHLRSMITGRYRLERGDGGG
jgi:thiosulfate reductase cytochrome b subunit